MVDVAFSARAVSKRKGMRRDALDMTEQSMVEVIVGSRLFGGPGSVVEKL